MKIPRYLTAKEVTQLLGISMATLYAYVSRGLIRSETVDGASRSHRYHAEDVIRLKERKEQRKNPEKIVQNALHWGTPIMESALTLIKDEQVFYRGYAVVDLIRDYTLEQVAALLWTGAIEDTSRLFEDGRREGQDLMRTLVPLDNVTIIQRLQIGLTLASTTDLAAYDLSAAAVARTGARILQLATMLATKGTLDSSIAATLHRYWCPKAEYGIALLNAALILCADHELNVSSFTARVIASADATPYMVVLSGLAALQGRKHGGSTEMAVAMLREVENTGNAYDVVSARLQRGERIMGFGHHLYAQHDPRAQALLGLMRACYPHHPMLALAQTVIDVIWDRLDLYPNIDFALATLTHLLSLPSSAGIGLFALGRICGWIGHAIEQYSKDTIIRPRATYIGLPPRR